MTLLRPQLSAAFIFLLCISVSAPLPADQSDDLPLTLEKSIERGLSENRKLKAAQEKIVQADQARKQARSEFLPKLAMTYAYKRLDEPETINLDLPHLRPLEMEASTTNNFQWAGTVTQPLFKGFGIVSNYQWAALGLDSAKSEAALEKIDLALRIKQAYFTVLAAEKGVMVAEQAVSSLTAHVQTVRDFFELDMIPANDLLKAEVQLGNTEYERVKAAGAAQQSRAVFNTLLVLPIDAPVSLEDILIFLPVDKSFDPYAEQALKQRPEIESIRLGLLQIEQQIRLARSKMYPEIGLQYRYIKEGDTYDVSGSAFHEPNRWDVSAVMSWTLWEWGKTHYAVDENKSKRSELQNLKADFEDHIRLEVKNALLKIEQAENNIPKATQAVEQGEENLRVSIERFNAQATTSTEVLDAQTLLSQARLNYYHAVYDHNLAKAELQRALGVY